jgi:hypothetical protein
MDYDPKCLELAEHFLPSARWGRSMASESTKKELRAQIARLMQERDLLLAAVVPSDALTAALVAVSEKTDDEILGEGSGGE